MSHSHALKCFVLWPFMDMINLRQQCRLIPPILSISHNHYILHCPRVNFIAQPFENFGHLFCHVLFYMIIYRHCRRIYNVNFGLLLFDYIHSCKSPFSVRHLRKEPKESRETSTQEFRLFERSGGF